MRICHECGVDECHYNQLQAENAQLRTDVERLQEQIPLRQEATDMFCLVYEYYRGKAENAQFRKALKVANEATIRREDQLFTAGEENAQLRADAERFRALVEGLWEAQDNPLGGARFTQYDPDGQIDIHVTLTELADALRKEKK